MEVVSPEPFLTPDETWISPAGAADRALAAARAADDPTPTGTRSVRLHVLGGRPVYEVETDRRRYWIRADDGSELALTEPEARTLVQERYGLIDVALEGELVSDRTLRYWGEVGLPAYVFHDPEAPGTVYAVQPRSGQVATSTGRSRVSLFLMRAHTFWPIGEFSHREIERGVLVLSGLLTLALGITGYFLLFPLRFKRKRR